MGSGVQTYLISELILPLELLDKSVLISSTIGSGRCCTALQITQARLSSSTIHENTGSSLGGAQEDAVMVNTSERRRKNNQRGEGEMTSFFIIQGTESRLAAEKPFHT